MKAAILRQTKQPLEIEDIQVPQLKPGQVLVKVLATGICHSQINEIDGLKGEDKFLPHLLGHEGVGVVEEMGSDVTKVAKGDTVILTWIAGSGCNEPSAQYKKDDTTINSGAITTFSQQAIISENRLVKIDPNIPQNVAALLGCAFPTGAGIVKNDCKNPVGKSIAIFGIGGIGASALMYAKSIGCNPIIAIDINPEKLEFAKELGATHTLNPQTHDLSSTEADFVIECSGSKPGMEAAYQCASRNGKVVIAGNLPKGKTIEIDPFDLICGKNIVGTWGGSTNPDEDIPYYASLYQQGKLPLEKLISKVYPLEEINQAVDDLRQGRVVRAIINPQ